MTLLKLGTSETTKSGGVLPQNDRIFFLSLGKVSLIMV